MTDARRLLFVSPRFLFPADSGGKIRTTQILRGLKNGKFRVTLVMPATLGQRTRWTGQIEALCDNHVSWQQPARSRLLDKMQKVVRLLHSLPVSVISDWDPVGAATVAAELESGPDVVVFDFVHSAVLAPDRLSTPSIMFTHNVEAEIFERHWKVTRFPLHRWIWRNQYRKMYRYERDTLAAFDTVIAVSDRDSAFFGQHYGIIHCRSIPTGVDTEFFAYHPPGHTAQVVFCGSMDWMANIDAVEYFADQVWPLVRRQVSAARMKVVGRTPPEALVRRLRKAAPEWEFTGFVEDIRDHIAGAAAFVIPLRVGGGTRIKAFEAMAMGSPVVSTSIGIEGLPVEDGRHYLKADEPEHFATQVISLLQNAEQRQQISGAARRLVQERFGFQRAADAFQNHCLETMDQTP